MKRKFLYILLIICLVIFVSSKIYAIDIVMNLNNTTNSVDNTIVQGDSIYSDVEYETTTSTTDYEDPSELSITNMINIILIVVGVVLILLGIAIIIKLK